MALTKKDFANNMALVSLNQLFKESQEMKKVWAQYVNHNADFPLYEVTRSAWVRTLGNVKGKIEYVMPVHQNKIMEIYKVVGWFRKGETMRSANLTVNAKSEEGRVEFVGHILQEDEAINTAAEGMGTIATAAELRKKYVGSTVEDISFRNPMVTFKNGTVVEE